MKFQLFREPNNGQLNWWVAVQGVWMGYYPASLFNGGIGDHVEWIGFGGEVFSSLKNPASTLDQMGSGWQAQGGWTHAAYLRNLRNQSNLNGSMSNNNGVASSDTGTGKGPNPYTILDTMNSGTTWGKLLCGRTEGGIVRRPRRSTRSRSRSARGDDLRGDSSATASVACPAERRLSP